MVGAFFVLLLEVFGLASIAVAVGVWIGGWTVPGGIAATGVFLLGASVLLRETM